MAGDTIRAITILMSALYVVVVFNYTAIFQYHSNPISENYIDSAYRVNSTDAAQKVDFYRKKFSKSTPEHIRAIYMTAYVASSPKARNNLIKFLKETDLNAIVIDVKDYTGMVSIPLDDALDIVKMNNPRQKIVIKDIKELLDELDKNGIYTIARIAVFQDPNYAKLNPDEAFKDKDGNIWKDRKGLSWVNLESQNFLDYITELSLYTLDLGFDEINLDYIRYPSDGNMNHLIYSTNDKIASLNKSLKYITTSIKNNNPDAIISADVFGMTTSAKGDIGVGQIFEDIALLVDYISPMVYPSHYAPGYKGMDSPVSRPYDTIKFSIEDAKGKVANLDKKSYDMIRPWLQDFDLGEKYGADELYMQIKALYDLGIYSWYIWDPANIYTKDFFYSDTYKSLSSLIKYEE